MFPIELKISTTTYMHAVRCTGEANRGEIEIDRRRGGEKEREMGGREREREGGGGGTEGRREGGRYI